MTSAKVSLPSASVFPISTVRPFFDFMMSEGRKALLLMLFSANPKLAVTLIFSLSLDIVRMAERTEQAPCLSRCIPSMPSECL